MNLNVASNSNQPAAGGSVCVWGWGGGKPNELWSFVDP